MRLWDGSAIVPLLAGEAETVAMTAVAADDPLMLVRWATPAECVSAIARLERERTLSGDAATAVLQRLDALAEGWHEIQPVEAARRTARRLLRVHPLRAADALQLAAAVVACEGDPSSLERVTLEERLADAARREGFAVLSSPST